MRDALEQTKKQLTDSNAGWVSRRDAAETLSKTAAEAVAALKSHQDDNDQDVRREVRQGLLSITNAIRGATIATDGNHPELKRMVMSLESEGRREVTASDDGFEVNVTLPDDRHQTVRVEHGKSQGGEETVLIWTPCAAAKTKAFEWSLKSNVHFALCAIAIREVDGADTLCMLGSFLADELTPNELKAAVKEVAFYGDWLENKLAKGEDIF